MARPTKKGLDYFPVDVGFFGDNNVKILKARYRSDGIAVYVKILCDVYAEGYFLAVKNWKDYVFVIADEIGTTTDKVEQIIMFLRTHAMARVFDKESELTGYDVDAIITSHGIQKRFAAAMKGRKKSVSEIKGDFWLLTEKEESEINTFYKSTKNPSYSEKNPSYSENNGSKSEINPTKEKKVLCTDVPRAGVQFFDEFPKVKPSGENVDFKGIDFNSLSEAFRGSKKFLQTRERWEWVAAHYAEIIGGKYSDYAEAVQAERPAAVSPAVESANARADREKWYSERRHAAEVEADKANAQARSFPAYLEAEKRLRRLDIEHAKAELHNPEKVPEIEKEQDLREMERAKALLLSGLTERDLLPAWHCVRCSDTGYLPNGRACDCYAKSTEKNSGAGLGNA